MDHNVPTDDRPADDLAAAQLGGSAAKLRGVRRAPVRDRQRARGNRARDRPGARPLPARPDDRLRRQSHLDARSARCARLRHRHLRGRARARYTDPAAAQAEDDAARLRRLAPARRHRQGRHPRRHRPHRRRRGRGLRRRVRGRRDPRPADVRPHDHLQHVHRGRSARGHDRSRRHDVRLPRGPARCAAGRRVGAGARPLARVAVRPGRDLRPRRRARRRRARASGQLGHEPGHGRPCGRCRPGSLRLRRPGRPGRRRAGARLHGPRTRHADPGHRGRPRLHRLVHERAHRGPARGCRCRRRQARPPARAGARRPGLGRSQAPGRGGRPRSHLRGGGLRVAPGRAVPCAWA